MGKIVHKVGLEFEIPIVEPDFTAIGFPELQKLLEIFIARGWKPKIDPYTKALVGVTRTSPHGAEEVGTDFGICSLEVALAPTTTPEESQQYWAEFKHGELLPAVKEAGLLLLGYGTQPLSGDLENLIGKKGHYLIWPNLISEDVRGWVMQNWPGLSAAQYNFEIEKTKVLETLNTLTKLNSLLWAAGANSPIAGGEALPYRCQRYHGYHIMAKDRLYDRWGPPPKPYASLCDYIQRCWSVPIFEILRDGKSYYATDSSLTTFQFIEQQEAKFLDLDQNETTQQLQLADLFYAIYFAWPDCRVKFNFKDVTADQLIATVKQGDDTKLLDIVDFLLIEVRPLAMQNHQEEVEWLHFLWLLLDNIEVATDYTQNWDYPGILAAGVMAQEQGLKTQYQGLSLGQHGTKLIDKLLAAIEPKQEQLIKTIKQRFAEQRAPADDVLEIFRSQGLQAMIEQTIINK